MLTALPTRGRGVTGDALSRQRDLCRRIVQTLGDNVFVVRANPPAPHAAIATRVADPPRNERLAMAITWDKHGGRVETRRLRASTLPATHLGWPGLQQVALIEQVCRRRVVRTRQVRAVITCPGPEVPAATLPAYARGP